MHVCQRSALFSTPVTRTVFLSNCMKHADHSFTNTAISNFERQRVLIIDSDKKKSNKLNALKCSLIFIVAPCMLIVLSPLFAQLMHTNYYKIAKQLKSFKITIVAPTCFGLHKPSSGSFQPVLR